MLTEIIKHKRGEVAHRKKLYPLELLKQSPHYTAPCLSLKDYLARPGASGVIAEFKRTSPSNHQIPVKMPVEDVSIGYMQAGASALSILTDGKYFSGSHEDLRTARTYNYCPILCKDFIIDTYQIHEARSYGADIVLLIAAVLEHDDIAEYIHIAHDLGMETLLEIHRGDDLSKINPDTDMIGVNNRDLRKMTTDLDIAITLRKELPDGFPLIAESGMKTADDVLATRQAGYTGFLIGSHFMQSGDPAQACRELIVNLNSQAA